MRKILFSLLFVLGMLPVHAQLEYDAVMRNNRSYFGLKDMSGKWVVQPQYTELQRLAKGYWAFQNTDYKWGVISPAGKITVPFVYDEILDHGASVDSFPFIAAKQDGLLGLIAYDTHCVVLAFGYTELTLYDDGDVLVKSSSFEPKWVRKYQLRAMLKKLMTDQNNQSAVVAAQEKTAADAKAALTAGTDAAHDRIAPRPAGEDMRPVLTILSPSDGSSYARKEVAVRYNLKSGDGSAASLSVYIDGVRWEPPTAKGVRTAVDELMLQLPQRPGRQCHILFEALNASGLRTQQTLDLCYVGEQQKPRLHLLAVGVGDYADTAIPKLRQAAKDATDFVDAVVARPNVQYSRVCKPLLLTDSEATAARIKSALVKLARDVEQDDVVMLFFSGHGDEEGRKVYFLSSDAQRNNYFTTAVKFDDIRDMMENMVAKKCRVVIFMDTCHSGAMFNTKGAEDNFTIASPDVVGFYSSTRIEKSNESAAWSNGIFTKALIEGINGAAADSRQQVTIQGLDSYIKKVVDRETEGHQSPIVENRLGNFILF